MAVMNVTGKSSNGAVDKKPGEFGRLIRELRTRRGLSQQALARQASVSAGYVGLIETGDRGTRPNIEVVRRFAQALDATVAEMEQLLRATGHLGQHEGLIPEERPTFAAFVDADPRLDRRQKELLKGLYSTWLCT